MSTPHPEKKRDAIIKAWIAGVTIKQLARRFHIPERTIRDWVRDVEQDTPDPSAGIDRETADANFAAMRVKKGQSRKFVITSAQNATPVYLPFLKTLLSYCEWTAGELAVIPYRYKNPTSVWSGKMSEDDWWAKEIAPYLIDRRLDLTKHLVLLADIKTQPTAKSPLQGFETLTGPQSAIIGHPKLEQLAVPTPQNRIPKLLTTTGAVTKRNYTPTRAGKTGDHHHTYGACVVEITPDGLFHIRQINAKADGSFCDLTHEYFPDGAREDIRVDAVVMGDTHVEFVDPEVVEALFGDGGIVPTMRPKKLVWHDVLDFYSANHHHRDELFVRYAKYHAGRHNVQRELQRTFDFVAKYGAGEIENVIVASNHHDHLTRWVKETDPRSDPENAVFWAKTFEFMASNTTMTDSGASTPDPFIWWGWQMLPPEVFNNTTFLLKDESYQIRGIEVGYHGDRGSNGARGNIRGFGKIGAKTVIGHSHTPGIKDGVYQVGTSSRLRLEYNHGPSSWLHTHCVIYPNGKRTLINVIKGKWRGK